MSGLLFPTRRSVSQIVRRHTPGSLLYFDDQELIGQVSRVDGRTDTRVDPNRLLQHVQCFLQNWRDQGGTLVGYYDIDQLRSQDLDVRRPTQVYWEPLSTWYQCSNPRCRIVHDARASASTFTGRCRECASSLTQFTYVFYHRCGSMQQLRPTQRDLCPEHGMNHLYFRDTRNLITSQWVCRKCDHASSAFYPVCSNPACRAEMKRKNNSHIKYQISYWREPWSYYTQKVEYVNLNEARAREFVDTKRGRLLIHEATIGQRPAGHDQLYAAITSGGGTCPNCDASLAAEAAFCHRCGQAVPASARETIDGAIAELPLSPYDGRVAWAILRDLTESRSLSEEVNVSHASRSQCEGLDQLRALGVHDVVLVKEFPLTTAAIGFTRERPSPPDAWLNAFSRLEGDPRTPIFTNTTTSEGFLVQLRADAIIEWLKANNIGAELGEFPSFGSGELTCKDWLIRAIASEDVVLQQAIRRLIHTYAHAMLKSIAYVCGLEASSLGELVWVDALAFAIYAGETEIGALSATFEQALEQLPPLLEDYAACVFDPTCAIDERGACVACLHLVRGCQAFNAELSRAYLVGGPADELLGENARGLFSTLRGM
jgi:hypothetical protein